MHDDPTNVRRNKDALAKLEAMLAAKPRPSVAELCRATFVTPGPDRVHTNMPWLYSVLNHSGVGLARAMLTHAVLHGGEFGCRNFYTVALWREPLVHRVFDRASLLRLCRQWAAMHPNEIFWDEFNGMARAFGRYAIGADVTDRNRLYEAGEADAAAVLAVAARQMRDCYSEDDLAMLIKVRRFIGWRPFYAAASRVQFGTASALLWGYVLARPGLSTQEAEALGRHIRQRAAKAEREWDGMDRRWLGEVREALLRGAKLTDAAIRPASKKVLDELCTWLDEWSRTGKR